LNKEDPKLHTKMKEKFVIPKIEFSIPNQAIEAEIKKNSKKKEKNPFPYFKFETVYPICLHKRSLRIVFL